VLLVGVVLASTVCMAFGLALGPVWPVWTALGISVLGLGTVAESAWRQRTPHRRADERTGAGAAQRPAAGHAVEDGGHEPGVLDSQQALAETDPVQPTGSLSAQQPLVRARSSVVPPGTGPATSSTDPDTSSIGGPSAVPATSLGVAIEQEGAKPAGSKECPNGINGAAPSTVLVLPRRRRFHRHDCRLVLGRLSDEVLAAEALEEGFSACTVCVPMTTEVDQRDGWNTPQRGPMSERSEHFGRVVP
jgi:hypothetical protein